jgi:glutamate racemase
VTNKAKQPIGIFDSGIGGLTVAHAIKNLLPEERLIYFGDTAHLPYGDKSKAAIQAYSVKIADVLLSKGCKTIVIACNSASSSAYDLLNEYTGSRAEVINVIDPMVELVSKNNSGQKVGLIGTKRTIDSQAYEKKLQKLDSSIKIKSLATPLLVPMIEEGFIDNKISHEIIAQYLDNPGLNGIKALILGCTHYPLIKNEIAEYYSGQVEILDSSEVIASHLKKKLSQFGLINDGREEDDHFLVSDFTPSFERSAAFFFHEKITLEKYPLWE